MMPSILTNFSPEKFHTSLKNLKTNVVFDIETDGLVNPKKLHLFVALDEDGVHVFRFNEPAKIDKTKETTAALRAYIQDKVSRGYVFVGHNILGYDITVLDRLLPNHGIPVDQCYDTLVVSRLLDYAKPGGHSIEAFGKRFGITKVGKDIQDWRFWTQEMEDRCVSDIYITDKLLKIQTVFATDPDWRDSITTEHYTALVCQQMHLDGFGFDSRSACELKDRIMDLLGPIDKLIEETFTPKSYLIREITPQVTKQGSLHKKDFKWMEDDSCVETTFYPGATFSLVGWQEFNPGSPKQLNEVLSEAGWRPTEKTKGHLAESRKSKPDPHKMEYFKKYGWKINEENLKTLPEDAPEAARKLAQRLILQSRLADIDEWLELYNKTTKSIHGKFNHIGAWTHRLSHSNPNLANVPSPKPTPDDTEFETLVNNINLDMRRLWRSQKGWRLVGTDVDGIQMRVFAHYTGDKELIKALLEGRKEEGTDIHNLHMRKLGSVCASRDVAKTFIYAFLLGAGIGMAAEILGCSNSKAKEAVAGFIESYPGLKFLKENQIPEDARRGWFLGLDGRKVKQDSEHLMLAGYLQNGEATIMKLATMLWTQELLSQQVPFILHTWPHDEWQTGVPDDDEVTGIVQKTQLWSIEEAGRLLNLKVPLTGSSDWGYNWGDTH